MTRKYIDKNETASTADKYVEKVETNQPTGRLSTSKEVFSSNELGATSSSIPGSEKAATTANVSDAAKKVKSKMKIAPDVGVQELQGKQVGGVPLTGGYTLSSVAGLSGVSAADDTSKIPYTNGGYRPATREGKKRSEILFEMDNTISEQVIPEVDDVKDLAEDPDGKQGYNGRKQFKSIRGKKNFVFVNGTNNPVERHPQQLLNECSVDFVSSEKTVYTSGQMIDYQPSSSGAVRSIDAQADYPTVYNTTGGTSSAQTITNPMHKGNYKQKQLVITTDENHISNIYIIEDKYQVCADPLTRDEANMNWQTDANKIAKSQIKLQTELGRETTDKWSPLGYVINQPYQYNMLMHDIEGTTGAIAAAAYRSAVSSLAFQRNILAKDGVNPQMTAVKMILEGYKGFFTNDAAISNTNFNTMIFNRTAYDQGSVAALIDMFDSTGKYANKSDILGMQRSLTMHLATAGNNIGVLRTKPEFLKALDKAHLFSTPSGTYNPMLPIYVTDKVDLITPLSLQYFLENWKNPVYLSDTELADPRRDVTTGTYSQYVYGYRDVRNIYTTRVQHPLIEGLLKWLLKHEGAFVGTFGTNATINIPIEYNMVAPNLFSFIICSALQDILLERNIIFRDVLFAGEQSTYIWDDLCDLKANSPLTSTQLTITGYNAPLKLGKMAADTKIREFWGTHWTLASFDCATGATQLTNKVVNVTYYAPWYMSEKQFGSTAGGSYTQNEGFRCEQDAYNMTIPSIRDGVRHEYVDFIKDMSDRDIRLSLDRQLTVLPMTGRANNTHGGYEYYADTVSANNNNLMKISALRYEANSDGRIMVFYDTQKFGAVGVHRDGIYCIPKELGWIEERYSDESIIDSVSSDGSIQYTTYTGEITGYNSIRIYWGGNSHKITAYRVFADSNSATSIDRSAALSQVFYRYFADTTTCLDANETFINEIGFIPAISYGGQYSTALAGVYNLDSINLSTNTSHNDSTIHTLAKRIWSMLQRFFFPINPFENGGYWGSESYLIDPMEPCFYFGVCGTLASDYTQDILERLDVHDQLGLDYTEDVFMKDSSLFR